MINLDAMNGDWDKAEGKDGVKLDDGKYEVLVSDASVFESQAGRAFFKMELTVCGGPCDTMSVDKLYVLDDPKKLSFLKKDLETMGIFLSKLSELPGKVEDIKGLKLNLTAKENKGYKNYYINGLISEKMESKKADGVPF